ncbi:hypothetical protein M0D69_13980 [Caballeronia sp. SEWSISQ10-4 2]|uniref:phage adaptor protein n=1 Tax=Caballeronia sp. SEWSISQ10-4 2 TaxID=2937438 RepID=UPI002656A4FB|nr:DUF6682 family protein [Caballeronia sp. SEWSISQ10-4 2]MDN7179103.1 hypothetical protein [Caballeronia sp. SEWSISQ10-4 2]
MPIPASALLSRAAYILQDEGHARWSVPELLDWINDAARETIVRRPAARSVTRVLVLKAGTHQELAERGIELLDVVRNIGADGIKPGRAITRVERRLLDNQDPDWHTKRPKNVVKHFSFDERAPRVFYVYPPVLADTRVEALHSELPPHLTAQTDTLDMGAEYVNTLVSYMAYAALSKDSEFANGTVAAAHYAAFNDAVGANNQTTTANSPNANHP